MSEGESRVSNAPHREAPITVSLEDYQKLQAEHARVTAKLEAAEKANNRTARWAAGVRTLAAWVAVSAGILGLCWGFWWLAIRGGAEGERARHNAESEAARYITMTHGEVPYSVVCVPHTGEEMPSEVPGNTFDMRCVVKPPLGASLYCDSDEGPESDGCKEGLR